MVLKTTLSHVPYFSMVLEASILMLFALLVCILMVSKIGNQCPRNLIMEGHNLEGFDLIEMVIEGCSSVPFDLSQSVFNLQVDVVILGDCPFVPPDSPTYYLQIRWLVRS